MESMNVRVYVAKGLKSITDVTEPFTNVLWTDFNTVEEANEFATKQRGYGFDVIVWYQAEESDGE